MKIILNKPSGNVLIYVDQLNIHGVLGDASSESDDTISGCLTISDGVVAYFDEDSQIDSLVLSPETVIYIAANKHVKVKSSTRSETSTVIKL